MSDTASEPLPFSSSISISVPSVKSNACITISVLARSGLFSTFLLSSLLPYRAAASLLKLMSSSSIPKSILPLPWAAAAISYSTKYPYQIPLPACIIISGLSSTVTTGSYASSNALSALNWGALTETSTTCAPTKEFPNMSLTAETDISFTWACALGTTPGMANVIPPATMIAISVRLVVFLTISFSILLTLDCLVYI